MTETFHGATYHECLNAVNLLKNNVEKFQGIEEEVFRFLVQISSLSGNFLPLDVSQSDVDNKDTFSTNIYNIIHHLWKFYQKKYSLLFVQFLTLNQYTKYEREVNIQSLEHGTVLRACFVLQKISILCGNSTSLNVVETVATKCVENLKQYHLKYFSNPFQSITEFKSTFISFLKDIEILALDVMSILCLSNICNKSELMTLIVDAIIGKIQNEILLLVNSTMENLACNEDKTSIASEQQSSTSSLSSEAVVQSSMNQLQLIAVSDIIKHILHLEKSVNDFDMMKIVSGDETIHMRPRSALKSNRERSSDIVTESYKPQVRKSLAVFGNWNWQEDFKDLHEVLSYSIGEVIQDAERENLHTGREKYCEENSHIIESAPSADIIHDSECKPVVCIKSFAEFLNVSTAILPLAVLGMQYKPLSSLMDKYEESLSYSLKSMKMFLNDIVSDVPEKCSYDHLYVALATCEEVISTLEFYGRSLQLDNERYPLHGILQLYSELDVKITGIIVQFLGSNLVNNVLQDASSHDWLDFRDYNEGETCSSSIRVWNIELTRIWHNLHKTVSHSKQIYIFNQIVLQSLNCLNNRYANCTPSYNRTKQVRRDILSIFLIVQNCLWKLNGNPSKLYPLDLTTINFSKSNSQSDKIILEVHSICQNLLLTLTFLSSPIASLSTCLNNADDEEKTINASCWLHEIADNHYSKSWSGSLFTLKPPAVVFNALSLIPLHESKSLVNTMVSLTVSDNFLCKLVFEDVNNNTVEHQHDVQNKLLNIFTCSAFTVWNDVLFADCVAWMLGNNLKNYKAENLIKSDKIWKERICGELCLLIRSSLQRTVEHCINYTWSNMGNDMISLIPESLQLELLNLNERMSGIMKEDYENCTLLCLIMITQEMECILRSIPVWIVNVFYKIQKNLEKHARKHLQFGYFGAQVIVNLTESVLEDSDTFEKKLGLRIGKEAGLMLKKLSVLFKNLCDNNEMPEGDNNLRRVLKQSVDGIREVCTEVFGFDLGESLMANSRLYDECNEFIHCLGLYTNQDIIEDIEFVRDQLVKAIPDWKKKHNLGTIISNQINSHKKGFRILRDFSRIGDDDFNHTVIADFNFDWERLISGHMQSNHSEAITAIVSHRWDMQAGAALQQDEISPVNNVKSILGIK